MPADAITSDTAMSAILSALPGARRALFARYHLGGCSSCAFSHDETLRQLCLRSGLEPDEVLAHLLESHAHDQAMLIEPADAAASRGSWRWIDVRTREEHEAIRIQDSELLTQELQQQLFAGDPEANLLLYDHHGSHALDQVAWFRGHGLRRTFALRGGIDAWSTEIDPTIRRYRIEIETPTKTGSSSG
jgi:rhodanese-related sulfurtransferase